MMDILGLTSTEAKQLLLINKKIEYTNKDHAAVVLKIIKERGYFQSRTGKVYIKSLENIVNDMTPLDCIYCRKMLDGEGNFIDFISGGKDEEVWRALFDEWLAKAEGK